jgi:restriction endonuclease S subunit
MSDTTLSKTVADAAITLLFAEMRKTAPCPSLPEVCFIHNGQGLKSEDRIMDGPIDVFGSGGHAGKHTEALNSGPFVVVGRKGSAGKVTYAPHGGWVTDTAYFATPLNVEEFRCKFLYYALRSLDFSSHIISTAIPGINRTAIYRYSVPKPSPKTQDTVVAFLDALSEGRTGPDLPELPAPLSEQRRVVARIEELAAQIEEARRLRQQSTEEADALVGQAIKSRFEQGSARGWRQGILGDYVTDTCYGTSEKTTDDDTGTPVLRMGNIQNGRLDLRDLRYLHIREKDRSKLLLKEGDIVVNRTNSAELVGKCAVFDVDGDYGFASYLIRLRLDLESAEPRLVACYINSPTGRAYMFAERKQMTGQANVNSRKLVALPISLPSLTEQRRIVAELGALQAEVDALKRLQAETAAELDALLPSILDKAFKGEL